MTDGKRSLVGMACGFLCGMVIVALFLGWNFARGELSWDEWASRWSFGIFFFWPYTLLYLSLVFVPCVLIGGLGGYCLGEDGARADTARPAAAQASRQSARNRTGNLPD